MSNYSPALLLFPLLWSWLFFVFILVRHCCSEKGRAAIFLVSFALAFGALYAARNGFEPLMVVVLIAGGTSLVAFVTPLRKD